MEALDDVIWKGVPAGGNGHPWSSNHRRMLSLNPSALAARRFAGNGGLEEGTQDKMDSSKGVSHSDSIFLSLALSVPKARRCTQSRTCQQE